MSEKVSVIWLTCGLPDVSVRCVAALAANTFYRPIELIWVDNGSAELERQAVRAALESLSFPFVEVMLPTNQGWVGGCLAGLAAADPISAYIALLNNDTRPDAGWLTALVNALDRFPHMGIVGSLTQNAQQWQGLPMLRGRWSEVHAAPVKPDEIGPWLREHRAGWVKVVPGMVAFFSVLMRRRMIDEIGFLDPAFGLGLADDDDYCARAIDAQWQVGVALDSYVLHDHRTTFIHLDKEGKIDLEALKRQNLMLFQEKRKRAGIGDIAPGVVLRYLGRNGSPFVMNIPARNLTEADLARLELERGITRDEVLKSGLYVEVVEGGDWFGPGPFCGARLLLGARCTEPVEAWGKRCPEHQPPSLQDIRGIGPETERALEMLDVQDVFALAGLSNEAIQEMAADLPRASERQLVEWRARARKMITMGWAGGNDDDA